MLDTETKRRIDTCRDILVGKVPDPKSQVEQITIALIYKFMDDMDAEAEELGGERSFFTGEFARYGWSKLMAPGLGGHELLNRYAEAIQRMNENPGIPGLFRDIFKNTFLPYRDPETLRSFLKEIHGFTYDHSERLGDAFEYLLSVLGSQGDAGQFRTPRHIIDFMVEIMDPKKDESLLDPACGTAGFLISAYKHILKHNSKAYPPAPAGRGAGGEGVPVDSLTLESPLHYSGDLLTPDDRRRLVGNIRGYDISPDMVRLSLVNLYLHGFTNPHIEEYDTLTSDEKWNELADVILANPPFMSPKGGIKPHKRFSVQSKRSEVLFVDYIAEHLTPNGRAAVVVPEGIIFQSQNAYRQLREMLVKHYLVAVISLPAGVFNPYSGVKTSILVMDKRLAKQRSEVLFLKIENDGFNLGAQRRPIDRNDLPEAVRMLKTFLQQGEVAEHRNVLAVSRERIGEGGEWNLSGERYRSNRAAQTAYEMVSLGNTDIFKIESGGTPKSKIESYWNGGVNWATLVDLPARDLVTQITGTKRTISKEGLANSSAKLLPVGTVLVSTRATIGRVGIARIPLATNQGFKNIVIKDESKVIPEYVAYMMKKIGAEMEAMATGGTFKEISKSMVSAFQIPLPPLEVQKEIVAEIEGYQKIIDGARQVVENYQPRIPINPDWPMVELGEVCEINPENINPESEYPNSTINYIDISSVENGTGEFLGATTIPVVEAPSRAKRRVRIQDVLLSTVRPNLKAFTILMKLPERAVASTGFAVLRANPERILPKYLLESVLADQAVDQMVLMMGKGAYPSINQKDVSMIRIPLPDFETQRIIVNEIEAEQRLVNANKELIQRFEEKIKQTINRIWGEEAD